MVWSRRTAAPPFVSVGGGPFLGSAVRFRLALLATGIGEERVVGVV